MNNSQMLKDAARALSLANLCYIAVWTQLLSDSILSLVKFRRYTSNNYIAVMLNVLLLAAFFWGMMTLARRLGNRLILKIARLVFPLMLLIPLNNLIRSMYPGKRLITEFVCISLAVIIIGLSDIKPWDCIFTRAANAVVMIMLPLVLITFAQSAWYLTKFADKATATPLTTKNRSTARVLWLVFDELDQEIAFSHRPSTVDLPEFDHFRSQAISASNAYPPSDVTLISMPALISGAMISKADPTNPSELIITFADSKNPVSWGDQRNVFSEAREIGFNTAVIGYYLPYCRIIGESLTSCHWLDWGAVDLHKRMIRQGESLIDTTPLVSILAVHLGVTRDLKAKQMDDRERDLAVYRGILEAAKKAAVDPDLGLILVHWSVPHPGGIYDRQRDDYEIFKESGYLDNLELADRSLREVRLAMEAAGMWENTVILVTSDHGWRPDIWRRTEFWTKEDEETLQKETDPRIPFMLKMAGQRQAIKYDPEFNTILTHNLLLALLKGDLTDPASVVNWLERHRSIGESPYNLFKKR